MTTSNIRAISIALGLSLAVALCGCGKEIAATTDISYEKVVAAPFQSYAIDTSGSLWFWGTTVGQESDVPENAQNEEYTLDEQEQVAEDAETIREGNSFSLVLKNGVVDVASGDMFALILKEDNTLWGWGTYPSGAQETLTEPVKLADDIEQISARGSLLLALDKDGVLWNWGQAEEIPLGNNTYDTKRPVELMDGVKYVSTAQLNIMVIKDDNSLWRWRQSSFDEGTTEPVKLMDGIKSAVAGDDTMAAITSDNELWCWETMDAEPKKLDEGVTSAAIDEINMIETLLYIKNDGTLWVLGFDITADETATEPRKLMDGVRSVSGHGNYMLAVTQDGKLHGWGSNVLSQLTGCDVVHTKDD